MTQQPVGMHGLEGLAHRFASHTQQPWELCPVPSVTSAMRLGVRARHTGRENGTGEITGIHGERTAQASGTGPELS